MSSSRLALFLGFALALFARGASAFFLPVQPTAIEYVNETTGHYVLIVDPGEAAAVDSGAAGPGWRRTGYAFDVLTPGDHVAEGNVCRFYAPSSNSHFFTGSAAECEGLRNDGRGWIFEKFAFSTPVPVNGACAAVLEYPIYRVYNNRGSVGDPNHRYTASPEVRAEMLARGWVDEGVAFCSRSAWRNAEKRFAIASGKLAPSAQCEDESLNVGSCVALNQLPVMPNSVTDTLEPWWVVNNSDYPFAANAVTGTGAHELFTAYPLADKDAVARHSFLQTNGPSSFFGIHVNSLDRTVGDYSSINPLYQFTTRAPAQGAADARVFPWGDGRDHHLDLSFQLKVATLRRADPQSHAYGHPTLQFVDRTTGQHLYVTLGTYGSTPTGGEDYLARDVGTGRVIVSTTFRADPSFGKRISGEWITCPGTGACNPAATDQFRFQMDRAAFATVLARARTLAATLSANPDDYFLANFHFNNEVYRDGEIGLLLTNYALEIFAP